MNKAYVVKTADGTILNKGDEITSFRGEKARLISCTHPRRVYVKWDKGGIMAEYFPSVFNLKIEEIDING